MEHKIYEVLNNHKSLNKGDEVIITEYSGCLVGVQKITLARKDNNIKYDDKKSYWFGSFEWIESWNLKYIRLES